MKKIVFFVLLCMTVVLYSPVNTTAKTQDVLYETWPHICESVDSYIHTVGSYLEYCVHACTKFSDAKIIFASNLAGKKWHANEIDISKLGSEDKKCVLEYFPDYYQSYKENRSKLKSAEKSTKKILKKLWSFRRDVLDGKYQDKEATVFAKLRSLLYRIRVNKAELVSRIAYNEQIVLSIEEFLANYMECE